MKEIVLFPEITIHGVAHVRVSKVSRGGPYIELEIHQDAGHDEGGLCITMHGLPRATLETLMLAFADDRTVDYDKKAEKARGTDRAVEGAA